MRSAARACRTALQQPGAPVLGALEALGLQRRFAAFAPRAARTCVRSMSRISLPMYWRCRAPPPRLLMLRAATIASYRAFGQLQRRAAPRP